MNNILETNLHLTHSPISIKDFNRIKKSPVLNTEFWREKESLDNASLYIIGKREAPVFVPRREISDEHCLILDVEVGKASFRIFIPALTNPKYSLNGFAGIKTEPEGLEKAQKVWLFAFNDKGEAVPNIGFTFDELIYYASNDLFHIEIQGDFTSAITYDVLYVGETVREKLTQRFKAHHALQDMLIEEKVISPSFDKSEELILMPFTIDSSIAFIFEYHSIKLAFLGDAKPSVCLQGIKKINDADHFEVDLLKLSHHGSRSNTSDSLLKTIRTNNYLLSTNGHHKKVPSKVVLSHLLKNAGKKDINLYCNYDWYNTEYHERYFTIEDRRAFIDTKKLSLYLLDDQALEIKDGCYIYGEYGMF